MKFPSLVKLPRNRQFKYKPRHYDPVIDDLNERVAIIKKDMGEDLEVNSEYKPRIKFRTSNSRAVDAKSTMIRLGLIVLLCADFVGYMYLGWTKAFQLILLGEILIGYVFFRFVFKRLL